MECILQKTLSDPALRILDVRSMGEYAKGHIPGAVQVDVGDWKKLATADRGLHDAKGKHNASYTTSQKSGAMLLTDSQG